MNDFPTETNALAQASTEQRNPRSHRLEERTIPELVDLFITEEDWVTQALKYCRNAISDACTLVADRIQQGGRLIYVGAGTSGRLGVVDASEMPPTFGVDPQQFVALIAGGSDAVFRSQEGAEDSRTTGASDVTKIQLQSIDVVVGIAASGRTPYVLGALQEAQSRGAATVLLSCNPNRPAFPGLAVAIDLPTGPEIITGSTRLKAGTATKLVLNMLSSIAMIRAGRVKDNLMIHVQATNEKLRDRATRLVMELLGCSRAEATDLLRQNQWSVARSVNR